MLLGCDKTAPQHPALKFSVEEYARQLQIYFESYFDRMLKTDLVLRSCSDQKKNLVTAKAKTVLACTIFPNDGKLQRDYDVIKDRCGKKTIHLVSQYTRWTMQLLGRLAECMIIEHCCTEKDFNKVCMNIALLRPDIYADYPDIDYDSYIAFSPSFKYIIYPTKGGLYKKYNVPDYNPNHTTKDIGWCKKDNILDQLKVPIPQINYLENAQLQIKTSLHCASLDLQQYFLTPVICFDMGMGQEFFKLKERYPQQIIYSGNDLFPDMRRELDYYFKILAAYAAGLIDHIDLTNLELYENKELEQFFRMPVHKLTDEQEEQLDLSGVIDLAETFQKPVLFGV